MVVGGIGCYNQAGSANNNFDGVLADVAVWDFVLDATTITALLNGRCPKRAHATAPKEYWPLAGGFIHGLRGTQCTNVNASVSSTDHPRLYR
jgi:hypothetical protein